MGWEFDKIGTDREQTGARRELEELRAQLKEMGRLGERLRVVESELKGPGGAVEVTEEDLERILAEESGEGKGKGKGRA